jgi:hypothetical protein
MKPKWRKLLGKILSGVKVEEWRVDTKNSVLGILVLKPCSQDE